MNDIHERTGRGRGGTLLAALLALLSSTGSIAIAGIGGWQRGTVCVDQVLFAGVSVLAALAAQLLPALAGRVAALKRVACIGLWLVCMASTALAHAWYLLAAQERAGAARVEAFRLSQAAPTPASRERSAILSDRAGVEERLARVIARACDGTCADQQRIRHAALEDRLAALDAEAQAAADARQSLVRWQEQRQQVKEDLVGSRLASSLSVSYSTATWVMALTYAFILEGVGCLSWAVVLRVEMIDAHPPIGDRSPAIDATAATVAPAVLEGLTGSRAQEVTSAMESSPSKELKQERPAPPSQTLLDDLTRVTAAVRDSTIRPTVAQVRGFLRCSQAYAQQIRRLIPDAPSNS